MGNSGSDTPDDLNGTPSDPLGLDAVDQQIRINELRDQVEKLGMSGEGASPDCPPEVEEQFLRNVIDYESCPQVTHLAQLERAGVTVPPPETLDDAALSAKLWEVIYALARRDVFLESTDHLSDRELYTHLVHESLREEFSDFPPGSGWSCHLDIIGSGSDEDNRAYLRYYAKEETRERWRRDWPSEEIPPHEDPPFDRDRRLPRSAEDVPQADR